LTSTGCGCSGGGACQYITVPVPSIPIGSGGGGTTPHHTHVQAAPAATWTINHGFGRFPWNVLISVGGVEIGSDVAFPSVNTVVLTFAEPVSGRAEII
jgi:hypothetical protein